MRIDVYLVQSGLFPSREKAKEAIESRSVFLNKQPILKPSFEVCENENLKDLIEIKNEIFVSRAAFKLKGFLDSNDINVLGLNAIDVGASSGGFSQILLKYGVKSLVCVDVGSNQLNEKIKLDSRVKSYENTDIRLFLDKYLKNVEFYDRKLDIKLPFFLGVKFNLLVCDVSFIEIEKIFYTLSLLSDNMILLFKPQFQISNSVKRTKNGVIKNQIAIQNSLESFKNFLESKQFNIIKIQKSILKGRAGNEEFFFFIKK